MAERHISLPTPFSSGDVKDWFQRFDICARANGWEAGTKAKKLPTLLEGGALAAWLELTYKQQEDYTKVKKAMEKAMMPMSFVSLDKFHCRSLRPGKAVSLYVHDLRKLLTHALALCYTSFWLEFQRLLQSRYEHQAKSLYWMQ